MSAAIKRGKYMRGDPGLLDIAKGAITGFLTGGPSGALQGAYQGIAGPAVIPPIPSGMGGAAININPPFGGPPGAGFTVGVGPVTVGAGLNEVREVAGMIGPGATNGRGALPPRGYHWNKTGYFLKTGQYVAPGTKAVRNRRRNPLNPRALDRAMGRLQSAKRASKKIGRISVRAKC